MTIRGVVCDFGGVLTSPLQNLFAAFERRSGVTMAEMGRAFARLGAEHDEPPLFELERGLMSEADFVGLLEAALHAETGRAIELEPLGRTYFADLEANEPMISYMRDLRGRGLRMALLTNNVREWEPLWRTMLPVDEIFEVVVDSAFVGMRKPEREIYELTLERLGLGPRECVFIDDTDVNCEAAAALGMAAVHFRSSEQAIAEVERIVAVAPKAQADPA